MSHVSPFSAMSKGKKSAGKAVPQPDVNWEQALTEERLEKDDWKACIVFVEAEAVSCLEHIASLHQVVGKGYRLKFGSITRDGLLESAAEDMKKGQETVPSGGKKSKQANTQANQIPHVAVCEQAIAASEQGNLSYPLLAKLLKYQMLRMRDTDIKKRDARTAVTETDKPKASAGKKAGGGGKSAGKSKGKNTPAPESDTVPLPSLPPSTMKKRGEEGDGPPPINDEPEDGPDFYFVISGFASVEFFSQLAPLGISAKALCKVNSPDPALVEVEKHAKKPLSPPRVVSAPDAQLSEEDAEEEKRKTEAVQQQLDDFWRDVELFVESTETGSMLRDMAQIEVPTPKATVPSKTDDKEQYGLGFFQSLSTAVYNLLDKYRQYQHYLEYIAFVDLNPPTLQQGQDLFLTPTPSTTVLTPSQNTPVPPSGKPNSVLSPMPNKEPSTVVPGSLDTRYYNALLRELPQECVSVPVMLHCIVEQVVVNMSGADPLKAATERKPVVDSSLFSDLVAQLAIPDDSTGQAKKEDHHDGVPCCPQVYNQGDDAERRMLHFSSSVRLDVKAVEAQMQQLSFANRAISAFSCPDKDTQGHINSQRLALQHFTGSEVSPELLDTGLLQLACEQMPLSLSNMDPGQVMVGSMSELVDSSALPVDYPFIADLTETAPQGLETALVAVEEAEHKTANAGDDCSGRVKPEPTLHLPTPRHSLLDFCILEKLSKHSLSQILNKDRHQRPYTDVYQHRMDRSLILASHSGYAEEPVGSYTWEKHYHTQVGFNNYLKHFDRKYSDKVEELWLVDEENKAVQEEEWRKMMEEKTKQLQEEAAAAASREDSSKVAKKDKKGGKASVDKKGQKDAQEVMSGISAVSLGTEEFVFQRSKAFSGYRIGDTVALLKCKVSTVHCPDGRQIRVASSTPVEGSSTVQFGIIGPDAILNASLQFVDERKKAVVAVMERCGRAQELSQKIESSTNSDPLQEADGMQAVEEDKPAEECSTDTLMQPPQGILGGSLSATVGGYLHVSLSSFGPAGDGSLPMPPKPELSVPSTVTPEQTSRPTSRKQSETPKKLSKKEQEAQQAQLLEQERLLEQQRKEEQERLLAAWEKSCRRSLKECKVQQLNLSTVAALHVKCQVHTEGNSAKVVIHQSYPTKTEGIQNCEKQRLQPLQERSRVLYPDGTLCKVLLDNSVEILTPHGTIYRSPSAMERNAFAAHVSSLQRKSATQDADRPQGEETQQPPEGGIVRSGSRVVFSGIPGEDIESKASCQKAGHQDDSSEDDVSKGLWVVTLASGEQYAWQSREVSGNGCKEKPLVEETITEEATGQQEAGAVGEEGQKEEEKSLCMPLSSLEIHSSVDPVTREEMVVREDGVCLVRRPSGCILVNYPDGTRFTTQYNSEPNSTVEYFVVECSGFARVKYTFPDSSAVVTLPHNFIVHCGTKGDYIIEKEGCGILSFSNQGLASYRPHGADLKYDLDYTAQNADAILKVCLNEQEAGALLSVSSRGEIAQHAELHTPPSQHTPLYYIVKEDGLCYQLMSTYQLDSLVKDMSASPEKVVLQDVLPGDPMQKSVDLLIPEQCSDPSYHVVPYQEKEITPPNLKKAGLPQMDSTPWCNGSKSQFGLSVGKSLLIGSLEHPVPPPPVPYIKALLHRQFLAPYQSSQHLRSSIVKALATYVAWRNEEDKGLEEVLPCDSRDPEERHSAAKLEQDVAKEASGSTSRTLLWDAYVNEFCSHPDTGTNGRQRVANSSATATKSKVKESTREEVEATKKALQSGIVPPYFESPDGKEFLATQMPNMQALASKLAQPKMHQAYKAKVSFEDRSRTCQQGDEGGGPAEVSVCSTPSTTCSTAVPMGDNNSSPSPSELGQVNTPSSVRPQNPTPHHADGMGTPTDARPLNPTPGHAFRDALGMDVDNGRPNNPTPALAYLGASGQTASSPSNFVPSRPAADYLEMQYEADSPIAETIAALEQDDTVAGSDVNPSESKDLEEVDPPKQFNRSTYFTVAGERRQMEIPMPHSLLGSKPGEVLNRHFANVEEPVRRKVMTSSVARPLASGVRTMPEMRGFELYPKEVAFGVLKEGCTYSCSVTIKNVGIDSCRFKIKQPPPSTGLKARYTPGPLAAGMKSVFEVEIYAMAVGAVGESSVGAIRHVLEIVTETSIFHLPITAIILTQSAYETRLPIHPQGKHSPDVKLLSDRPTSRDRINRPSRDDLGQ